MQSQGLREIYELVGELTTTWNQAEELWYLCFTGLMRETPREQVDTVYNFLQTGAQQRQLTLAVADAALPFDKVSWKRDDKQRQASKLRKRIGKINADTNDLAGKRNAYVHAAFEIPDYLINPVLVAIAPSRPTKLTGPDYAAGLRQILLKLQILICDLADLRDDLGDYVEAESSERVRRLAGLPLLRPLRQVERERIQKLLTAQPHIEPPPRS